MHARLLRIGTYNVLHGIDVRTGTVDLGAAADAIAALRLDVVALQEVDRGLARSGGIDQTLELAERLDAVGVFAPALLGDPGTRWEAVPTADSGGPAYGVGLLSRLPVRATQRRALPGGGAGARQPGASPTRPGWDREPRTALTAELDVGDERPLRVTSTHLSYLPWRGLLQLRAAARAAAGAGGPAILAGDCNLPVAPVRAVLGRGWQHAGGTPTYPASRPRLQVDQIAVTGGVAVRAVEVAAAGPSDHLAVVATVAVPSG